MDQVPASNTRCSKKHNSNDMEQVRELLTPLNRKRLNGVIVATNFIFRQMQPYKERAHPAYEFRGDTDGTREVPEEIERDEVKCRITMLFNLSVHTTIRDQQRVYNITILP